MSHIVIEPSKFRKIACRIVWGILFFPFPRMKFLFSRALMHVSLGHMIKVYYNYKFKQPKKFKYYLSMLMCIKDEAQYMQEWIEYYLLQGVEHFYIYNNNGTDNTLQVLKKYIDKGLITWINYPGLAQQRRIYNDAIARFKNETQWLGLADCDEFVVPLKSQTIVDWLKTVPKCSQVLIHWCVYGSSGHKKQTKGLVIERFTKHAKEPSKIVKAILNPRSVVYMNVHWHLVFGKTINEKGELFYGWKDPEPTAEKIRVNHYIIKSYEEYIDKKTRGDSNYTVNHYDDDWFHQYDINDVNEPHLMQPWIQKIKKRIAPYK